MIKIICVCIKYLILEFVKKLYGLKVCGFFGNNVNNFFLFIYVKYILILLILYVLLLY